MQPLKSFEMLLLLQQDECGWHGGMSKHLK